MLKKRIGLMLKGLLLAGALSLTACAGSAGNDLPQFSQPAKGQELVILHTSMGDIKLQLFPEEAPKAVENFTTHAKNGYYDGVIFHRVMQDFMIQGGDPEGTGMGGESIWGGGFGYERSDKLRHFKGALAMAHSQLPDSNGSQFYIVQNGKLDARTEAEFKQTLDVQNELVGRNADGTDVYVRDLMPASVINKYLETGGTPHLDLTLNPQDGHTVFGHVVEGMDVVDAIAAVETNDKDKPLEDVVINSISFEIVE